MTAQSNRRGFTLLEVMAVVALISVVFFVALNFYTDLSRASARASNHTRDVRRASAILDRIARDLEGAFLVVKPPEMDPFAFPWIFLGEARLGGGASDRLKFISRNHDPTRTDSAETNLAVVAFISEMAPDDSISLYRWSSPRLPESLDKSFPRDNDDGVHLLAEGLQTFEMTFLAEDGEMRTEWDSSTLIDSSSLPLAVEIQLSLMAESETHDVEPPVYRRKVLLPVRPLDLVALADPNNPLSGGDKDAESEGDEDEEDGEDGDAGEDAGRGGSDGRGGREKGDDKTGRLTNRDCWPTSVPDSAPAFAKMCVGLANSAPDMVFDPSDYPSLPEDCKSIVNAKCR